MIYFIVYLSQILQTLSIRHMIQRIGKCSNSAFEAKQKKYSDSAEYASRKQESSHSIPIAELGKEKVFRLGGVCESKNKKVRTLYRLPNWGKKKSSHPAEKIISIKS